MNWLHLAVIAVLVSWAATFGAVYVLWRGAYALAAVL